MTSVQLLGVWNIIGWIKDWRQSKLDKKAEQLAVEKYSVIDIPTLMQERYEVGRLEFPASFNDELSLQYFNELKELAETKKTNITAYNTGLKAIAILEKRLKDGTISTSHLKSILDAKKLLLEIRKENERI